MPAAVRRATWMWIVCPPPRSDHDGHNTLVSQGSWAGNIDCKHVCKGHRVMLNTYHDGGLLFFGDVHAAQGDTESTPVTDRIRLDDVNRPSTGWRRRGRPERDRVLNVTACR